MRRTYSILIMGASYGSLLGTKLALAGHDVHLVCLPAEADLINTEGAIVRLPIKGRDDLVEINSKKLPGKLTAGGTGCEAAGLRPDRAGDAGAAVSLSGRARPSGCGGQFPGAVHVHHEYAPAALSQACSGAQRGRVPRGVHRPLRMGRLRPERDDALQS
jgi:hypothetical protein